MRVPHPLAQLQRPLTVLKAMLPMCFYSEWKSIFSMAA